MLFTIDLMVRDTGEDLIDEECVAVATVLTLQSSSVYRSEFDAPEPDTLVADCDSTFGKKIFNTSSFYI